MPPEGTVIAALERTVALHSDRPALRAKREGLWTTLTWSDYYDQVRTVARGLMALGVAPGSGVVILGFNRPQWFLADLGAIAAGALPAGIYTTSPADQCHYVASHCDARVAILEDVDQLEKFREIHLALPRLEAIVLMVGESDKPGVLSWNELLALADQVGESDLDERIAAQGPDDVCTLIYTSGTTGPPKAVMLRHRNILWVVDRLVETYRLRSTDSLLSYLPLSHIAEQIISLHSPLSTGCCTWFAESLELLPENLREVRPHFFFAVPRVWEKMQAKIEAVAAESPEWKRRLGRWAKGLAEAAGEADQRGVTRPRLFLIADRLVLAGIRAKLGLDRARVAATGAAPTPKHTLDFFLGLGIPILEVYGMSECTGPATLSTHTSYRLGAAGRTISGAELDLAADGEILIRGPHVFAGYFKDERATREAVDADGWLHSGDVGTLDADGFLTVTDRKKELLITSGGKNVAPQPIENRLKAIRGVALAAVVGDGRKHLAALLTLDDDALGGLAADLGSQATDAAQAADCPKLHAYFEAQIDNVNTALASFETIKRFSILPQAFSIDTDELTPTMKLRRHVVTSRYAAEIDALYPDS